MHAVIESNDAAFNDYWNRLVESDPLHSPLYASARRQQGLHAAAFTDLSFVVMANDDPIFGCSLTVNKDYQGRQRLGFLGREASTLVNRRKMDQPSNNFSPDAVRLLQSHFCELIELFKPDYLEYLDPVSCGLMSPLTQVLLEKGARPSVRQNQVIKLTLSEPAILSVIDPRYRELIQWGRKHARINILDDLDVCARHSRLPELCNAIGDASVNSGVDCWDSCTQLMADGKGFVLHACAEQASGGLEHITGLFVHNAHTCHFVIDDAALQAARQPLVYIMLWEAIIESRRRGCHYFDFGGWAAKYGSIDPAKFGGTAHTKIKVLLEH